LLAPRAARQGGARGWGDSAQQEETMNPLVRAAGERAASAAERQDRMAALRALEREYLAVRQMAPRDAHQFIDQKVHVAAQRVQSLWRGTRVRRSIAQVRSLHAAKRRDRAAEAIQRHERRRARQRQQATQLRQDRDQARAELVQELPLIRKLIIDGCRDYRLVEARTARDVTYDATRILGEWAELRQRSNLRAAQRIQRRAEASLLFEHLAAVKTTDDCEHEGISHIRPLTRGGKEKPPSAEDLRLHLAATRVARLEADAAQSNIAAVRAAASGSAAGGAASGTPRQSPRRGT